MYNLLIMLFLGVYNFAGASDSEDDKVFFRSSILGSRIDDAYKLTTAENRAPRSDTSHPEKMTSLDKTHRSVFIDSISGLPIISGSSGVTGATGYCEGRDMFFILKNNNKNIVKNKPSYSAPLSRKRKKSN